MSFTKSASKIVLFSCLALVIGVLGFGRLVAAGSDDLLRKYETGDREFRKTESGDAIIYWHSRMIDEAIVEKDYIRYEFDKNTKELIEKDVRWRDDLPEHLPPIISREQAEAMVEGKIQFSRLLFISPETNVYPVKPTPKNPCWTVRILDNSGFIKDVIIIDAVEGEILGHGVPPPSEGFSLSGPQDAENCTGVWENWYENADYWFELMGYDTATSVYPSQATVRSHVQSHDTAMFYEVAHGTSNYFRNLCNDIITAYEVNNWIEDYSKMPFTFLGSCDGMCDTGPDTLSYEFRKGSTENTCTVGYCGMSDEDKAGCWDHAVDWQAEMFYHMSQGDTVKEAFDAACDEYPICRDCVRFAGDEDFVVVPVVPRELMEGDTTQDKCVSITDAMFIAQYMAELREFSPSQYICADTFDDGVVSIGDAMHIAQWLVDPDGTLGVLLIPLWESPGDDDMLQPVSCSSKAGAFAPVAEGKVTLEVTSAKVAAGGSVLIPITVEGIPVDSAGLGCYNLKVTFDPKMVNVNDINCDGINFAKPATMYIDNTEGVVLLNGFQSSIPGPAGDIVVAYLAITATGNPGDSTVLNIEISTLADSMGDAIIANGVDGVITIGSDSHDSKIEGN